MEKRGRNEVILNKTYQELAEHYVAAIIPACVRAPRDKAAVEGTVGVISSYILVALRNRQFLSLPKLNEAIWEQLESFNHKPFQKREGSRASAFEYTPQPSYKNIKAILVLGQGRVPVEPEPSSSPQYGFTRGAEYYGRR